MPRQTLWYVITGAPCSGKTTVIRELERRGYRVGHEAARAFIEEEQARGRNPERIRADARRFERVILERKATAEAALPENALVFLDRAVPDSIAYYRLAGLDPQEPIDKSAGTRYAGIFLFERLRFRPDNVRTESDAEAARIENMVVESYAGLGYRIVRIPPLPVPERIHRLFQHIGQPERERS